MSTADRIRQKLEAALQPQRLDIHNDSHLHAGHAHAGAHHGDETHFRLEIVSAVFAGENRVARRMRTLLQEQNGNFKGADKVSTLHDMRFAFLENDTKPLFATAYDGDWDAYIDDFATMIPDYMDIAFSAFEGWPGIQNTVGVKDWIANHQIAAEGWYVANPELTVRDTRRLKVVGKAVDDLLDKINN